MDGPVGEQAREAPAAGIEEALVTADVEIGLLLAGEARRRKVLGGRRASHREAHVLPVLLLETPVAGKDLASEVVGESRAVDDLPGALAAAGQARDVIRVEAVERLVEV